MESLRRRELQNKLNYVRDSIDMFADLIRIRVNHLVGRYKNPAAGIQIESNQSAEQGTKRAAGRVD